MEYLQYIDTIKEDINKIDVLNLVINGIPSIPTTGKHRNLFLRVLNLVINGIPSIQEFKNFITGVNSVLNLVINGIPSILYKTI